MTYKLTSSTSIIRILDGACIPVDPANSDYAAYLVWVSEGGVPEPYTPPPISLPDYAANTRWLKETGGITVNGVVVRTDRESQAMAANAYALLKELPEGSTADYKGVSGWVSVTVDQIKPLALAIGMHVQACFSKERAVDDAITAGTITTTAEIDAAFAEI